MIPSYVALRALLHNICVEHCNGIATFLTTCMRVCIYPHNLIANVPKAGYIAQKSQTAHITLMQWSGIQC